MPKSRQLVQRNDRTSALLAEVEAGEEVIITRRGKPIARIFTREARAPRWPRCAAVRSRAPMPRP
ncbi:MAG: type II toxin-antitoxin system Phd/YefM family antitoxin [Gammaproteobacteria bacterium]